MTIREFPLAWRWTSPSHAVFSDDALAEMHPLEMAECKKMSKPKINSFSRLTEINSSVTNKEVRSWLLEQNPNSEERIIICWTEHLAIQTTWRIFTEHWGDFCYPSSDDLIVFADAKNWVLLYDHSEKFQFGTR